MSVSGGCAGGAVDELLALLGQHWRLVLIYPGGLTALGATALLALALNGWSLPKGVPARALPIAALWLLVSTLLPLPQTRWPYALDLATLLLALELPYWALLLRRSDDDPTSTAAALLSCYPLLALAIAALGQGAGTLVLLDINRSSGLLHLAGIGAWSLALPPLLGLGPWRADIAPTWLVSLRRATHLGLLAAAGVPANDATPRWAALLAFAAILVPLAMLHHWWRGAPERWNRWQPWLTAGFGLLIAGVSAQALLGRMR